jgi:hypothetical protein
MQTGKRQTRFGLDASCCEHRHAPPARLSRDLRQQTRLADTRLAAKDERLATRCDLVQERRQQGLFLGAPE